MNNNVKKLVELHFNHKLYEEDQIITNNIELIEKELTEIFKNINSDIQISISPDNLFNDNSLQLIYRNITTYSAWVIIEQYIYSIIRSLNKSSYFSNTTIINKTFDIASNFNINNKVIPVFLEIKTTQKNDIKLSDNQLKQKNTPIYLICKYSLKNVNTIHINEINLVLGSSITNNITDNGTLTLSKVKMYNVYKNN